MNVIRFERKAEYDLDEVFDYTVRTWGIRQAEHSLTDLQEGVQRLATAPLIGQPYFRLRPGLRRLTCGKHSVFYTCDGEGILVIRILHNSMLPSSALFDSD